MGDRERNAAQVERLYKTEVKSDIEEEDLGNVEHHIETWKLETGKEEFTRVYGVGGVRKSKCINNEYGGDENGNRTLRSTHGSAEVGVGDVNVTETET